MSRRLVRQPLLLLTALLIALAALVLPRPTGAAAVAPGTLEVSLTGPSGARLTGTVVLYRWQSGSFAETSYTDLDRVTLPATRSFPVTSGSYYVEYLDGNGSYYDAYSGGGTEPPFDQDSPGVVRVTAGTGATTSLAVEARPPARLVTGRVVGSDGVPVEAFLDAERTSGRGSDATSSDPTTGAFELRVPAGTYRLRVQPVEVDGYDDLVRTITVGTGPLALGDVVLQRTAYQSVSGTVTRSDGTTGRTRVELYECPRPEDDDPGAPCTPVGDVLTQTDGTFTIPGARAGRPHTVSAFDDDHALTYLGGVRRQSAAQRVTPTADVTGLVLTLLLPSTVGGLVTAPDGTPAEGVSVRLMRWDEGEAAFRETAREVTDPAGRYTLRVPTVGSYGLRYDGRSLGLGATWYGGTEPTSVTAAGVFTSGETRVSLVRDQRLPVVSQVAGVVSGPDGTLAEVTVTLQEWTAGRFEPVVEGVSDANGRYSLAVPGPGRYSLYFDASASSATLPVTAVWLGGGAQPPVPGDPAGTFVVTGDAQSVVRDQALLRAVVVTGAVSGPEGPAEGVDAELYRWDADLSLFVLASIATSDIGGGYLVVVPGPGEYALHFATDRAIDDLEPAWLVGTETPVGPGSPGTFPVTTETEVLGFDRQLTATPVVQPAALFGTVVDEVGRPVSGAAVLVCPGGGDAGCVPTETDAAGSYALTGMRPGYHTVRVVPADEDLLPGDGAVMLVAGETATVDAVVLATAVAQPAADQLLAGTVVDRYGVPVDGAALTLQAAALDGSFTSVPERSPVMSSDADANPVTTGGAGAFGWHVRPGRYRLAVVASGCTSTTTPTLTLPAAHDDLVVVLGCSRPAPAARTRPALDGTLRVGQQISAVAAAWNAPLSAETLEIERAGVLTGRTSWTLGPDDVGVAFRAVATGRRPAAAFDGAPVTFTAARSDGPSGSVAAGAAPTPATAPTFSGTTKVGSTLTAAPGAWSGEGTPAFGYRWLRAGRPITGATASTYRLTAADAGQPVAVEVTATRPGYASGAAITSARTVAKLASTTAAKASPAKVAKNKPVTLVMTVKAAGLTAPLGTVQVKEGRKVVGRATLTTAGKGVARIKLKLPPGRHKLVASYAGSVATLASAAKPLTVTVKR